MAHIVDVAVEASDDVYFGVPITKMEEQPDGTVIVGGLCTSDNLDLDDQIIDLDFSKKGLTLWQNTWKNVRQMHSTDLPPAGNGLLIDATRPDGVYLEAHIIEPGAVRLTKAGVYKAFSVGVSRPRIIRDKIAKNGRVIDGIFSEVSIVDFPANPVSAFSIIKRKKSEITKMAKTLTPIGSIVKYSDEKGLMPKTVEDVITKSGPDPDCKTCDGTGKIKEGNVDCPDCVNKAFEPDTTKAMGCDKCSGTGLDSDGNKCMACQGMDVDTSSVTKSKDDNSDDSDSSEDDTSTGADDDNDSDGDGDDDSGNGSDDNDDGDDSVKKTVDGVPYALRRAHDILCDAYSPTVITASHPAVSKQGYKALLEPGIIRSLLGSVAADGAPDKLASLAGAVGAATMLATMGDAEIAEAQLGINKAFSDAYPTAHPTPGSITPGQFTRSYLSAGRTPALPSGSPRIPGANSSIDAEQFASDGVSAGRESDSPENTGSQTPSNATAADQIAAATADAAMNAVATLHDHIASAYPTICSLDNGAGFSLAGASSLNTDGSIKPIAAGATPELTKEEKLAKKAAKQAKKLEKARKLIAKAEGQTDTSDADDDSDDDNDDDNDNDDTKKVNDPSLLKAVTTVDGEVLLDTDVLNDLIEGIVLKHLGDRFEDVDKVLAGVKADIEKIGSEPDPARAPMRGGIGPERALEKAAAIVSEADRLREQANTEVREQIEYLTELKKSGHPEMRLRAENELSKLLARVALEPAGS